MTSVTRADFVRRSDRSTWAIASGFGSKTTVSSRWLWEIEPGGELLFVTEHDGAAGQPVIRKRR